MNMEPYDDLSPVLHRIRVGFALRRYELLCDTVARYPPTGEAKSVCGLEFTALTKFLDENIEIAREFGYRGP